MLGLKFLKKYIYIQYSVKVAMKLGVKVVTADVGKWITNDNNKGLKLIQLKGSITARLVNIFQWFLSDC